MIVDDMSGNINNSQVYAQQAQDNYRKMSRDNLTLIKEIKDLYLDEVLGYDNRDSNIAKLHSLVHNHHY